jgi:dienelactone hydrolase
MGDRLAGMGYVTLIPDIYYRAGQWAPFDVATVWPAPESTTPSSSIRPATDSRYPTT